MRSTSFSRLKLTLTTLLFLLTLSLLTACGGSKNSASSNTGSNGGSNSGGSTSGGSNPGNTGGSGGGGSQSAASFVYLINNGSTKEIQGLKFGTDNSLAAVPGSPYTNGGFSSSLVVAGSTLVNDSAPGLRAWTIDSNTGALTPGNTISGVGGAASFSTYVYASAGANVLAYSANNGTLTQVGSPVSVANLCMDCQAGRLQVSNDGKYVYTELSGFHDVNGFAVLDRASDGSISNARNVAGVNGSTSAAAAVVVSHDSRYIYEFNQSGEIMLWKFDPATATATLASQKAAAPAGIVSQALISPDGKYLAAVSAGVNRIDMFSINASTGAITPVPGAPFSTGTNPVSLAFSSDSQTLFVDCRGDGSADLFAYHIGADGALTQVAHQSLGGDPFTIAVK